ncbi:MAG: XRE family transcriptional regulator [Acidobacteria bacterium]|nr:MAG: XRE family transcriptional regulator [Acidobacteriota bacterium]
MAEIDLNLLPAVLRGLRVRSGRTQVEVAAKAGVPQANLSRWESGKVRPSLESLVAVLTALGIDFRDLQDALEEMAGGHAGGDAERQRPLTPPLTNAGMLELLAALDRRVTQIEHVLALSSRDGDTVQDGDAVATAGS